jgi:hypothetical protein
MMFSKPPTELTFDDIQALVDSEEPESVTLEYKRQIDTSSEAKKELAKDVSAMANSQGGHLIIGLDEERHRPKMPDTFVGRMLGNHKVEEWLDQVLNSNIQQRTNVHIKPVPVPGKPDECVVVVHVPSSSRVPHMVTAQSDNRYYVRHNCEVLPAEEYEVRDMYQRGRRMREEVEKYLKNRGFADPEDDPEFEFGINSLTRKLGTAYFDHQQAVHVVEAAHTKLCFVSCPWWLDEWIDTSSQQFGAWFQPTERRYFPYGLFVPHHDCRPSLHGVLRVNFASTVGKSPYSVDKYLGVHRNGYVEYGYGAGQRRIWGTEWRIIEFVRLVGRFWQFLGFVRDLYQSFKVPANALVALSMANVEGTDLGQFADGWSEPPQSAFHTLELPRRSLERHVWILKEVDFDSLDEARTESVVRDVAARIAGAYGQEELRCFRRKDGKFPEDMYGAAER